MEFGLEQVFDSIAYNFSTPDPEPGVDDLWRKWPDRCDDLELDAYLKTTEGKKQFRKNMLAKLKPLSLAKALGRSLQSPQSKKEREDDQAFYIWVKEQVIQNHRSYINDKEFKKRNSSPAREKRPIDRSRLRNLTNTIGAKVKNTQLLATRHHRQIFNQERMFRVSSVARLTICSATALKLRISKKTSFPMSARIICPKRTSET